MLGVGEGEGVEGVWAEDVVVVAAAGAVVAADDGDVFARGLEGSSLSSCARCVGARGQRWWQRGHCRVVF